jgi:CheY-like chemotaxis protein
MTIAQNILPHLPYLRRFARSLTGRQESGDAYVASVIETLIEDPSSFPSNLAPRPALYQLFLQVWNSVKLNGTSEPIDGTPSIMAAHHHLTAITPLPRQAFLLVSMEGFSPDEAASILNVSRQKVDQLLDEAGQEIAGQMVTNVLIIEDEPLIAMDLESVVTSVGHVVQGVARTKQEAVEAFANKRPGLVLADIQLADGSSGLDAVHEILAQFEVPVIFVTAFPEQLLTGQRPEPTFLIPKPFQPEVVKAVISQALFFNIRARNREAA